MTKLIIQIPCYNEEETIGVALDALPREIPGVDAVEWLIIDDGSTDRTVEVARAHGVDHVVSNHINRGLARAFTAGLDFCLKHGADIIVNTDADNQYNADDIPKLIKPILDGNAEVVIGTRPISEIRHFSPLKKFFQKAGSWTVKTISQTPVDDAPSGFRALSREAAMRMHVFSEYTYTLETIIQAGKRGMAVTSVPIRTNEDLRESRLIKSIPRYLARSFNTMVRILMTYQPMVFFMLPGSISFSIGVILGLRYLYFFFFTAERGGHLQSLILSAILLILGGFLVIIGLIADLISVNRKLLENIDYSLLRLDEKITTSTTEDKTD